MIDFIITELTGNLITFFEKPLADIFSSRILWNIAIEWL